MIWSGWLSGRQRHRCWHCQLFELLFFFVVVFSFDSVLMFYFHPQACSSSFIHLALNVCGFSLVAIAILIDFPSFCHSIRAFDRDGRKLTITCAFQRTRCFPTIEYLKYNRKERIMFIRMISFRSLKQCATTSRAERWQMNRILIWWIEIVASSLNWVFWCFSLVRPFSSFSLPFFVLGPSTSARCRCTRSLWRRRHSHYTTLSRPKYHFIRSGSR